MWRKRPFVSLRSAPHADDGRRKGLVRIVYPLSESDTLGLSLDASGFGMGTRGQRFEITVKNGVAEKVNIEAPGKFEVSSAEHVLGQL